MTVKKVDLHKFAAEMNAIGPRESKRFQNAVYSGLQRAIPMMAMRSPVDTGRYAQSWGMEKIETGALFGNYAPYAAIIEYGARPYRAPMGPLLSWAKRVLQDPSQPPHYSSHVWALAKSVQNKIAERGQAPKHILEAAIPEIIALVKDEYMHGNLNAE